jgi:hypothetical protein
MAEHPRQEQAEQEDQLAQVLQLRPYPRLGRVVGWAAPLVQGRPSAGAWPPPVPDNDEPPTAA